MQIGILCKHALKVFNMKDVFILPSQYILNRWTKYAKRGFIIEKQRNENADLKSQAARIARKATSWILFCIRNQTLRISYGNACFMLLWFIFIIVIWWNHFNCKLVYFI